MSIFLTKPLMAYLIKCGKYFYFVHDSQRRTHVFVIKLHCWLLVCSDRKDLR